MRAYENPTVRDFGTVGELTKATGFVNAEDGGSKLLIHHQDFPLPPVALPSIPLLP
jgi:hypothetical protein